MEGSLSRGVTGYKVFWGSVSPGNTLGGWKGKLRGGSGRDPSCQQA